MLASQFVPKDETVLTALAGYRASLSTPESKPNAKRILKALLATHPEWRLTHQRMVKILKREGKVVVKAVGDENDRDGINRKEIFSPGTLSKISTLDQPVRHQNILPSRLRPKSSISFVYGNAVRQKTPDMKVTKKDADNDDVDYVPNVDEEEDDETHDNCEGWTRTSKPPTPKPPTPKPPSPPTFVSRFLSPSSSSPPPVPTSSPFPSSPLPSRVPSPDLPSTPLSDSVTTSPLSDAAVPYCMEDDVRGEDTQCFAGVKDMCIVM
ncbi:hypothetical protein TrVE_jg10443 [Triparma verrucosa]|uniref:Uncharacterized protein n=1 Tax=Triparma verrucosa TaxID=1606542 RepID=A0A9W7C6U6_9STRA|nr:hypothetical protein TrVE_jg10443 [Triparma verrucosa]